MCKQECDEFIFNMNRQQDIGWTIDEQSPLYKGLTHVPGFYSGIEKYSFSDIAKYNISQGSVTFNADLSATFAAGVTTLGSESSTDGIPVNPCFTHEYTFEMQAPTADVTVRLSINSFTDIGGQVSLIDLDTAGANNQPINHTFSVGDLVPREWYMFRVIIYGHQIESDSVPKVMDHFPLVGKNVKFDSTPCRLTAGLTLTCAEEVNIRNWRVGISTLYYGRGFIQSSPLVETLIKNNNSQHTYIEVQEILRKYFIPYSVGMSMVAGDCPIVTETFWTDVFSDPWLSSTAGNPLEWVWADDELNLNENSDLLPGIPV